MSLKSMSLKSKFIIKYLIFFIINLYLLFFIHHEISGEWYFWPTILVCLFVFCYYLLVICCFFLLTEGEIEESVKKIRDKNRIAKYQKQDKYSDHSQNLQE